VVVGDDGAVDGDRDPRQQRHDLGMTGGDSRTGVPHGRAGGKLEGLRLASGALAQDREVADLNGYWRAHA